jgi:hypothetical protein
MKSWQALTVKRQIKNTGQVTEFIKIQPNILIKKVDN